MNEWSFFQWLLWHHTLQFSFYLLVAPSLSPLYTHLLHFASWDHSKLLAGSFLFPYKFSFLGLSYPLPSMTTRDRWSHPYIYSIPMCILQPDILPLKSGVWISSPWIWMAAYDTLGPWNMVKVTLRLGHVKDTVPTWLSLLGFWFLEPIHPVVRKPGLQEATCGCCSQQLSS